MTNPEIEPEAVEPVETPTPAAEESALVVETPTEPPAAPVDETPAEQAAPAVETETAEETEDEEVEKDERKRRLLLLLLLLLLVCLCCVCGIIFRYWLNPQPLPEMLVPPQASVCYAPTYKFSITGVDGPVAVAGSPDDQRIYVAETDNERLVKAFDRNGNQLLYFAPPGTDKANREPKYMAVSPIDGRVYLVDRTSNAIDVYDANGVFLDAIIGQHMTMSKYMAANGASGTIIHYEGINKIITYGANQTLKVTFPADEPYWSPLGLRFTKTGDLIYTDKSIGSHSVNIIPAADLAGDLSAYNPQIKSFGSEGPANDQFSFPQTVVVDTAGNYYVSDGNNSRITAWTPDFQYKTFFGFGSALNGALNLPRGTWINDKGCLHVADAVGSLIRVYDVSGADPALAFEIGGYGVAEGFFNYPVDVFIDGTGRLYVADRANNRIQVWSY